jgi:hypothetical protein
MTRDDDRLPDVDIDQILYDADRYDDRHKRPKRYDLRRRPRLSR